MNFSSEHEYIALCSSYIRGEFGDEIPGHLNAIAQMLISDSSPETPIKLQVQALKNALYLTEGETDNPLEESKESQYFERFLTLAESNHANFKTFLMEDLYFIINTLAGITEDLDDKVTQLVPCQMQLHKLQQISHAIVKNANFGILAVNQSNIITMFNDAAAKILAVSPEVIQQTFQEAFSALPRLTFDFLFHCLHVKGCARKEIVVKGEVKVVSVETDILIGRNGQPEGAVLLLFDITSREREKKELEESIKLAAVGKLAAGFAHEIKNPLSVIKGFSQLLLTEEYTPGQQKKFLQLICQEVDQANGFIRDFINLGKPKQPHRKTIDACSIVEDVILLIQSQCLLEGVTITQNLECRAKTFADPDQLKQVLINLAKNSLEAMEDITLPVRNLNFQISRDTYSETLTITVSDTGTGIPEDIMDKVTSSFFTTKKFGTGLGLNICNSIIEQHGGTMTFMSKSKGTTIAIKLPLVSSWGFPASTPVFVWEE